MDRERLPITYDASTPLGFVYHFPLAFLPFAHFFDDIVFVTDTPQRWLGDVGFGDRLHSLNLGAPVGPAWQQHIVSSSRFARLAKKLQRRFVMYAPLTLSHGAEATSFVMNSPELAGVYENKHQFRKKFASLIRIPDYLIRTLDQLKTIAEYTLLKKRFGVFVLQDEESCGSRATFVVKTHDDYQLAIEKLSACIEDRAIVVSQFIEGQAASTQVCITKYGIFSSGVQRQLIASKHLCNPELKATLQWCGGEISAAVGSFVRRQVDGIVTIVGEHLAKLGYKGIFGIDFIIAPDDKIYVLEANTRMTGYSQLISESQFLQGEIPFLLLHALELADMPYEVSDFKALPGTHINRQPVSLLVMSNPLTTDFRLRRYIRPGVYGIKLGRLVFKRPGWSLGHLQNQNEVLIICPHNRGDTIASGAPFLKIIKHGTCMNRADLNAVSRELLELVKRAFQLPADALCRA